MKTVEQELYELEIPQLYQLLNVVTDKETINMINKMIKIKKEGKR